MRIIILLLLLIPLNLLSQRQSEDFYEYVFNKSSVIKIYGDSSGFPRQYLAMGLIIGKQSILTNAHAVIMKDFKIHKISVFYNLKLDSNNYTTVDTSSYKFKSSINESSYSESEMCNDFIILPLSRTIESSAPEFDTSQILKDQRLYVTGPNGETFNVVSVTSIFSAEINNCLIVYFHGMPQHGYSGSPVFNNDKKVVGILVGGYDNYSETTFTSFLKEGVITPEQFTFIKLAYSMNFNVRVAYFLHIKNIIKNITNQ